MNLILCYIWFLCNAVSIGFVLIFKYYHIENKQCGINIQIMKKLWYSIWEQKKICYLIVKNWIKYGNWIMTLQAYLPLTTVDFSFVLLSYRFWYRQNKLESVRTVNIPNVTICFMVPSFQILMKIICPNSTLNCIHIRIFDYFFFAFGCIFITRYWL